MIRYAAFQSFWWLWLVPALVCVMAYAAWSRRRALARFAGNPSSARVSNGFATIRVWIKAALLVVAWTLLVFALAQPQWGKYWTEQKAQGRDIIVAIDVSRSMLAEDVTPSRLERAKADVRDLVAAVEQSGGHRVGLIAFAGAASLKCPLTQVTSHFKLTLDALGPRSVAQGGTMIGDCIRLSIDAFDDKTQNFRDLILITDGEDMDSFPQDAAAAARDAGITIYAIGLGDASQGARIPTTDKSGRRTYIEHQGEIVWSKLDDRVLNDIARTTSGIYIPAGTRSIELDRIFRDVIEPKSKREMDVTRRERLHQRYQWFLAPAVLLIMLDSLIRDTRTRRAAARVSDAAKSAAMGPGPAHPQGRQSILPAVGVFLAAWLTAATPAIADDAASLVREGNRLYEKGNYAEAAAKYRDAAAAQPNSPIPLFNQATATYQSGDFAAAAKLYEQARSVAPEELRPQINYALGNCHLQQAMRAQSQPGAAAQEAKTATQFFRDALSTTEKSPKAASVDDAARFNMELAKRLIQLAQQQQQQQQQSGQDRDPNDPSQQQQQQQQQEGDKGSEQKESASQDKGSEQPAANDQQGKQQEQSQATDKQDGKEQEPAQPSGQSNQKLTPEEANERLRSAINRAQLARARRLNEQDKNAKGRAVEKDW
jgi:Ca-activated chloride channel family protein